MAVFEPRVYESAEGSMRRRIGETIGFASVCWIPDTGSAIFDSEKARMASDELSAAVLPLVGHSILLNRLGWKMAIALGDAEPTADQSGVIEADPEALLDRLLDQIIELKGLA